MGFHANKHKITTLIFSFTPSMVSIVRLNRTGFRTMSLHKFGDGTWVEAKGEVTAEVKTRRCNMTLKTPPFMQDVMIERNTGEEKVLGPGVSIVNESYPCPD